MSATNQFENDLLGLIFTNVEAQNVGDATGLENSLTAGSAQISLHTNAGAVSDTDTLATANEAAYTNYARQTVARSAAGWTVTSGTCDNDSAITYPSSGSGPETEDQFGICLMATGNYLQIYGSITTPLVVNNGVQPEFAAGALDISLD